MKSKETFLSICREDIKRDGIEELLKWLEGTDFFTAPASTRFHGNYEGGLCEHSLNVHRELTRLNDIYQLGYSKKPSRSPPSSTTFARLTTISAEHATSRMKMATGLSRTSTRLTKEFRSGTAKRAALFCSGTSNSRLKNCSLYVGIWAVSIPLPKAATTA